MYKRFFNLLFNFFLILYISSFFEDYDIIQFNEFKNINEEDIYNISLEKHKNYGLINYNNNDSEDIYKIHYPNNDYFLNYLNKTFTNNYEDKIIYFEEVEIHFKTILFMLFFINSILNNKNIGDALVTDLNLLVEKKSNHCLDNIAGMHEIKNDIKDYIHFINNKDKYLKFGARLPKGILLVGPPGCGKTLIAKSIAGETGINMYAISASDINEMFVGVGSKRIRKLFKIARDNSPSIIFIDEIDSIGTKRGGFNKEFDNVLNKILVEMDGFKENENVMVFAATNRIKDLDPALLRSGRFDRKIFIDYPNKNERKEIIEYYLKNKEIDIDDTNKLVNKLSKTMSGLSGADIENIINQASINAVRKNNEKIQEIDITDACEEIIIGIKKKERIMNENERNIVAHHEIGHAIVGYLLKNTSPPIKISIIPRGENILGYAQQEPIDKKLYSKNELLDKICVLLGGRLSEEVFFGNDNITTGASDDIEKLSKIINSMVYEYGMFEKNINYREMKYLGQNKMDELNNITCDILEKLEKKVKKIIEDNKDNISKLSLKLLEDEEIYNEDIEKIVGIKYKNTL